MIYKRCLVKKRKLIIKNDSGRELVAQNLSFKYLRYIKKLKNKNRMKFTYNKKITWVRHINWYIEYLKAPKNFFYILKSDKSNYGTIGIKMKNDGWHIYSVIRDDSKIYEKNLMSILVNGVLQNYIVSGDIFCEVVRGNSAMNWYSMLGFELTHETKNSYYLVLRKVGSV